MSFNFRQLLDTDRNTDELKTDFLRLENRTLKFANSFVPLDNLSLIEVIDLSTERPIPTYFYILGFIGVIALLANYVIPGILMLGVLGFLFYQFWQKRVDERFGLSLITNSGRARVLLGRDQRFLKEVAEQLSKAIGDPKITTFVANFNNQKVDIGTMSGGVVTTNVDGEIKQDNN